jgi:hypothetical protein
MAPKPRQESGDPSSPAWPKKGVVTRFYKKDITSRLARQHSVLLGSRLVDPNIV